jgi:hypothetical protein
VFRQLSCRSFRGLTYHGVFDYADHYGNDCTEDAATYGLSDNGTDIDILSSPGEHGQERGENLPTAKAAKRACDCVADCAEIVVLESSTCGISADGAGYQLDDDVDDRG